MIAKGEHMALRIALPNKGRLSERSIQIMKQAGIEIEDGSDRRLFASVKEKGLEIMFLRAQDIVRFVYQGAVDAGITGKDLVFESGLDVVTLADLNYGYCRLVVAVPEAANINSIADIKEESTVATSFPNLTKQFFSSIGKKVNISIVSGATEITPYIGVADLIVDLVSTGSTLKTHRLKEISTIVESNAVLVANRESLSEKGRELEELTSSLRSVSDAENKKYLMADVPIDALDEIRKFLPGIAGPTVMNIMGREDIVAVHVVVDKDRVNDAVLRLKALGATGILIVPIDRMVP